MSNRKALGIGKIISEYDNDYIESISLKDISTNKELKDLLSKLEKASHVITEYYSMLYNDYVAFLNSDNQLHSVVSLDEIKKYKSLASKIQKVYYYTLYLFNFENPFKALRK